MRRMLIGFYLIGKIKCVLEYISLIFVAHVLKNTKFVANSAGRKTHRLHLELRKCKRFNEQVDISSTVGGPL